MTIAPLVANRVIPLDKCKGAARPIGVGKVLRRICGKYEMSVAKKDVVEGNGSLQLCAGQKLGARLRYTLCILYLNQMTLMPYCSSRL